MRDLSLHLLDLAENSLAAGANLLKLSIHWDRSSGWLRLALLDNGRGMEPDLLRRAADPFFSTRFSKRIGLGLPLFQMACTMAGGYFFLSSFPGAGTCVRGSLQLSHPDRKPMGNLGETLAVLAQAGAEIVVHFRRDCFFFSSDTRQWRRLLGKDAFSHPQVFGRYSLEIAQQIGSYQ